MRILKRVGAYCILLLLLVGCWDEQLLKDVALINSQAFDIDGEENDLKMTIAIVTGNANEKIPTSTSLLSAEGKSVRDARTELDKKIGSELFASKNQVTLFSKELAERDIYAALDGNYRSPLSALTARLAVVEQEASEALHVQPEDKPLISDYLQNLLTSAEDTGAIPKVSLQYALATLYDIDQDLILPKLEALPDMSGVKLTGVALFNRRQMTGSLNSDETIMLLLLNGSNKGERRMTRKVNSLENPLYDYITVDVEKVNRSLKVTKGPDGSFNTRIDLTLKLDANEYPSDDLYKASVIKRLNEELSEQFTEEANRVLNTIQEANCDYLAIGRQIRSFYSDDWVNLNWQDTYPTVKVTANVKTEIINHGIIN